MPWNAESVLLARETIARLLEEIRLADYLFGVEPTEGGWEVRVECRCRAGSYSTRFGLETGVVQACQRDPHARRRLRAFLRERLGDCTRTPAAREQARRTRTDTSPDIAGADVSTLGGISEYSSTAGGCQPSAPGLLSGRTGPGHPMTHFDAPDPLRRELYWYALEEATQDPHPPDEDLAPAEEAALHLEVVSDARGAGAQAEVAEVPVSSIMSRHVRAVQPDATVPEVVQLFAEYAVQQAPVVDGGRLIGLVSFRDVARVGWTGANASRAGRNSATAREIMQPHPVAVRSDTTVRHAANLFSDGILHALPVVSDRDRLVGIVTSTDLIRYLAQ
ncbi:MAG: CBS domain-containing protein [Myxococcales bacterium]|nr:CBS domain-containing protein [Myxococcales bacterium]